MDPRIPEPIQPTLQNYLRLVNDRLPDLVSAFYIVGSIALDGFNERFSDIDFVAVLRHEVSPVEMAKLREIHRTIERGLPRWKFDGGYFQVSQVGCTDKIAPYPYYRDGKLHKQGTFESNLITWWILKNHGIGLRGTEPQSLSFSMDWNLLIERMKENLNSYWVRWTRRPGRYLVMLSDWGIQWAVLGILRQYFSFKENSITTKAKAAEYALDCLPSRWHLLIQEAIDLREGEKASRYASRISRANEAVSFLKFVIQTCNAEF